MSMQNHCNIQICYTFSIIVCSRYRNYVAPVVCIYTPCIISSILISLKCRTWCNIPIDINGSSKEKKWSLEINRLVIISGPLSIIAHLIIIHTSCIILMMNMRTLPSSKNNILIDVDGNTVENTSFLDVWDCNKQQIFPINLDSNERLLVTLKPLK